MKEDEINSCPFCGSNNFGKGTSWTSEGTFDYIECKDCKCRGPLGEYIKENVDYHYAIIQWNRRV